MRVGFFGKDFKKIIALGYSISIQPFNQIKLVRGKQIIEANKHYFEDFLMLHGVRATLVKFGGPGSDISFENFYDAYSS